METTEIINGKEVVFEAMEMVDNKYLISRCGLIYSTFYNKILKGIHVNRGYERIGLSYRGKPRKFYVHLLVAVTFLGDKSHHLQVNHKNEITTDNRLDNLEWVTPKYNANYGKRGAKISKSNTNNPLRSTKVAQYDLNGELVKIWSSMSEAGRNGYSQTAISNCCLGISATSSGFKWEKI